MGDPYDCLKEWVNLSSNEKWLTQVVRGNGLVIRKWSTHVVGPSCLGQWAIDMVTHGNLGQGEPFH